MLSVYLSVLISRRFNHPRRTRSRIFDYWRKSWSASSRSSPTNESEAFIMQPAPGAVASRGSPHRGELLPRRRLGATTTARADRAGPLDHDRLSHMLFSCSIQCGAEEPCQGLGGGPLME